jgi:hypothetical protein
VGVARTKGPWSLVCVALCGIGCGDSDAGAVAADSPGREADVCGVDAAGDAGRAPDRGALASGELLALTYNVAGLPMGFSSSMPERYMPLIGPLLNGYELVLLQESWQTPDPNPGAPLRVYHEILVEASEHPYKSEPDGVPWGMDPDRPSALLGDGLNMFSEFPFDETVRVRWPACVDIEGTDCLALKGFSLARTQLDEGVTVDVYNLHMDAGGTAEDDAARELGIEALVEFMAEHSRGRAVIVGGDFNLRTTREPAASQFARLLDETDLLDACTELACDRPGSIDKFLFRSSDELEIRAERLSFDSEVFITDDGAPLSDHDPVAVRFAWSVPAP